MREYPRRSAFVVGLLIVAGFGEGIGILSLLPLLSVAVGDPSISGAGGSSFVEDALSLVGIEPTVGSLLILIFLGILVKSAMTLLAQREAGYAGSIVATDLRLRLIQALLRARWSHFASQTVGGHANAISSEALRASAVYLVSTQMLAAVVQVAVYALLALIVAPSVTLASLVFGGVIFAALRSLMRITKAAGRRQTELLRSLAVRLTESLSAIKPLKAMAQEDQYRTLIEADIHEINRAQRRQVFATAALPSLQEPLIVGLMAVGLYAYLALLDIPFERLLFMALLFYRTVTRLGSVQVAMQKLMGPESAFWALRRTIEEAKLAQERSRGESAPRLRDEIRFENVSLAYGNKKVLEHLRAEIPGSRLTAIIGPSGSGKTSIVDLITGLVEPNEGTITVDGVPLSSIDMRSWRSQIGYVPQEMFLFHDTVASNVSLHDPQVTMTTIEWALRMSEAWEFVSQLEDGPYTVVGERGTKLSGGQRQRIAIARAIARRPSLLILDEATTSLDRETERKVLLALRELPETTVIGISHQPAISDVADSVIPLSPLDGAVGTAI